MRSSIERERFAELVAAVPKVSLHDHLDGGLRPETIREIADEIGHGLPVGPGEDLGAWFRDSADSGSLERYLETFSHTVAVTQRAEDLRRVARECVEDLAADGVVYAEVRYAPELHTAGGLELQEVVRAVAEGLADGEESAAEAGHGIAARQLVCAMRQNDRANEIVDLAAAHRGWGVVGFDIAGPEAGFPPARVAEAFGKAAAHFLPTTVHAGEGDGLESIRDALLTGRALRLGHGVRIREDIELVDTDAGREARLGEVASWVRDRGITLEISPSSNLQTGAFAQWGTTMADHPFDDLYQLGFAVTVNTDNRLMSGTTLTREMLLLAEAFDYGLEDLGTFTLNAAQAAFLPIDERGELLEQLAEKYADLA